MGKLQVWIDGACEPVNPGGIASYGVVVKSEGVTVFADSAIVGSGPGMSNNVAEYSGLIAFLEWYIEHADNSKATVHSDSSLLINQMTGYWRARRGLYLSYYKRALEIIHQNNLRDRIEYRWVPRERNQEADKLSKDALFTAGITPSLTP
ncbi:MAG: ribonuclease HI family protein [Dehalococcoidia bacterium]|nr:ribonuclease HI family protein [Dehalococcoidia bacterium]